MYGSHHVYITWQKKFLLSDWFIFSGKTVSFKTRVSTLKNPKSSEPTLKSNHSRPSEPPSKSPPSKSQFHSLELYAHITIITPFPPPLPPPPPPLSLLPLIAHKIRNPRNGLRSGEAIHWWDFMGDKRGTAEGVLQPIRRRFTDRRYEREDHR